MESECSLARPFQNLWTGFRFFLRPYRVGILEVVALKGFSRGVHFRTLEGFPFPSFRILRGLPFSFPLTFNAIKSQGARTRQTGILESF